MSSKTEERKKQNRRQISGMSETQRQGRGPNKVPFKDKSPEEQAKIRAARSRAGKAAADKMAAEARMKRAIKAGKIGGPIGGPIGGKAAAKTNQETGYQNLVNAREAKDLYKTMNYT